MAGIARHRIHRGEDRVALYQRTVLLPVNEINIDDFVNFLPLNENKDLVTNPEYALVNILQKLAESDYLGEVNILMVQMVNTKEEGDLYPSYLPQTVRVTAVLYGSDTFNPWLEHLTQATAGQFCNSHALTIACHAPLSLMH